VVERSRVIQEDRHDSVNCTFGLTFLSHRNLNFGIELNAINVMLGGSLDVQLVGFVVNALLLGAGSPDKSVIDFHPHLVLINSEDLVIHVSETTRSELVVAESLVGVRSDNINGGLLHTSLAETSPASGTTFH